METLPKLTSADLEVLPEDDKLYELIEGELFVSRQPSWDHQYTCGRLFRFLDEWNEQTGLGVANAAPGLIFAEDDDVAPDLVWISQSTLSTALGEDRSVTSPRRAATGSTRADARGRAAVQPDRPSAGGQQAPSPRGVFVHLLAKRDFGGPCTHSDHVGAG